MLKEHLAIHVLWVSKSAIKYVQEKATANASGLTQTTHPGGVSLQTHAKPVIVAHREHLAIHAPSVGWSTTINALEGGTASADGGKVTILSQDGVFQINRAMSGIAVRREHLATHAHSVGR